MKNEDHTYFLFKKWQIIIFIEITLRGPYLTYLLKIKTLWPLKQNYKFTIVYKNFLMYCSKTPMTLSKCERIIFVLVSLWKGIMDSTFNFENAVLIFDHQTKAIYSVLIIYSSFCSAWLAHILRTSLINLSVCPWFPRLFSDKIDSLHSQKSQTNICSLQFSFFSLW